MGSLSNPSYSPRAFDKAMVFVDGTNLLNRLKDERLKCESLRKLCEQVTEGRQLIRVYFYTVIDPEESNLK